MFIVRVASAALLFVSQVVLARWMGASEYGVYVSLWTAVLLLGGFSHLGLSAAMMRLVPQYQASGAFDALRGILLGGRLLAVASATAVAALACVTLWLDGKWLGYELSVPVAARARLPPLLHADGRAGRHRPRPGLDARSHRASVSPETGSDAAFRVGGAYRGLTARPP